MKKLLFILLFIFTCFSYSQQKAGETTNLSVVSGYAGQFTEEGLRSMGSGTYLVTKVGSTGFVGLRTLEKRAMKHIEEFCARKSYKYEIVDVSKKKQGIGVFPKVTITFRLKNQDGSYVVTKEDAKKQLLELKEFLDMGIITQEEYDKKAAPLKKVLLGN